MAENQSLRHEEIWDDTELLDSWNAAVEEYKYYHSLHARGEKVEDVLRKVDETTRRSDSARGLANGARHGAMEPFEDVQDVEEGEIDVDDNDHDQSMFDAAPPAAAEVTGNQTANPSSTANQNVGGEQPKSNNDIPSIGASVPQALLAGQDEALKGLMMSWYYAGYYTGLYEGQQRAHANNAPG